MSGYPEGLLLILFGRPRRWERRPLWRCAGCRSEWVIHEHALDRLVRGMGCADCRRPKPFLVEPYGSKYASRGEGA